MKIHNVPTFSWKKFKFNQIKIQYIIPNYTLFIKNVTQKDISHFVMELLNAFEIVEIRTFDKQVLTSFMNAPYQKLCNKL